MDKITKREIFECLLNMATTTNAMTVREDGTEITLSDDMLAEFAKHEIELLDKKSEKAKERAADKKATADEMTEAVFDVMSDEDFEPIADIAERVDFEDVTISKVTYRLTKLVKLGRAEKKEITIPATEDTKARRVQGYKRINTVTEVETEE